MIEASIVNLAELGVLVVGVVLALQQLKEIKQTRQAELVSVIMESMDNVEWWSAYSYILQAQEKTYDEWIEMGQKDPKVYAGFNTIMAFLNKVGWFVQEGYIELKAIEQTLRTPIIRVYENTRPLLDEWEKKTKTMQGFPHLEYMYMELKDAHSKLERDYLKNKYG